MFVYDSIWVLYILSSVLVVQFSPECILQKEVGIFGVLCFE